MKKNSFLWAALSMTAALVMTACSNDDNANESPVQQNAAKTIPYTVTVNGGEGGATTRATVADDPSDATNYHKTLYFAAGDKLYVTGTNIKGVLDLQAGDEGKASGATFSGDLTYSGEGSPADNLQLTATLVSAQQTDGEEVTINATTGAVTVNYPTTAYCADVATAVQEYSNLTGTSTYAAKSFSLTQQTAFLNFEITFEDGTATGTALSAVVNNNSSDICTANVTTTTESEKVVAKFVLPVAAGTTLSSANVKMGDKEAISFGASQTLTGKVYNVKKTTYNETKSINDGPVTVAAGEHWLITGTGTQTSNAMSIGAGATVTLDGVNISSGGYCIKCAGDATIILKDGSTNTLTSTSESYPALWAGNTGTTLTIQGNTGVLNVTSGQYCAGIGGGYSNTNSTCGNIRIEGGVITAQGGNSGAGIGSDSEGNCGDITISGGTVEATGGHYAAGIGGGASSSCGTITITSGVTSVTATKGAYAPNSIGIGNGATSSCGTITIGGTIYWDGSAYQNGGDTYLINDITYPAP